MRDIYIIHGDAADGKTIEYRTWLRIKQRCLNPNNPKYEIYGGRGITICKEWREDYAAFLNYVGRKPKDKDSIERIDNDKGYEPGNIKWATAKEQARNYNHNRLITYQGITLTLVEWTERTGFSERMIRGRLNRGWTIEETFTIEKGRFR